MKIAAKTFVRFWSLFGHQKLTAKTLEISGWNFSDENVIISGKKDNLTFVLYWLFFLTAKSLKMSGEFVKN